MSDQPSQTITKPIFEPGKNFAFLVNKADAEKYNQIFIDLGVNQDLTKKEAFAEFIKKISSLLANVGEFELLQKDNRELLEEVDQLKAKIKVLEEANQEDQGEETQQLEMENKSLVVQVRELQELLEQKPKSKPTELAPNQLLINLPDYQHHLISQIAVSKYIHRFNAKLNTPRNIFFVPLPENRENKKALMSVVVQNLVTAYIMGSVYATYHPNSVAFISEELLINAQRYSLDKLEDKKNDEPNRQVDPS